MSIIQNIREKGAWIMFGIIALALIAFILQDYAYRQHGGSGNSTIVGKINGHTIERVAFEQKKSIIQKIYEQNIHDAQQLNDAVWNDEVENIVMGVQYKKLGIQVTNKELGEILFSNNPPQWMLKIFSDNTGQYHPEQATQFFAQVKKGKYQQDAEIIQQGYIVPTIQQLTMNKYNTLMEKSIYIPKWLVEKKRADNSLVGAFSYIAVPYTIIPDDAVKISDGDIKDYVATHAKTFEKKEETRNISYVAFSLAPTGADSAVVYKQLLQMKDSFATTTDAKSYLSQVGSEINYYNSYLNKKKIQQSTAVAEILKLKKGQVYGPYIDGNDYCFAKMVDITNWPDSAKVRHILIATNNPQNGQVIKEDTVAHRLADSIANLIKSGVKFESLCTQFSDDPGSKQKGGVYDYFPQGQMVQEFNDLVFGNPVGTKRVIKTQFGYHYVEILAQKNVEPAYKIAYLAKPITASSETINTATDNATKFAASSRSKKIFESSATNNKYTIVPVSEVKTTDYSLPSLSDARSVVRWVYNHKAGNISEPLDAGDKMVVVCLNEINKKGVPPYEILRYVVEEKVRKEKKAKIIVEEKIKHANSLQEVATNLNLSIHTVDSIRFAANQIQGIGYEAKLVGASVNKSALHTLSPAIVTNSGIYFINLKAIGTVPNLMDVDITRRMLINDIKIAQYRSGNPFKAMAKIEDFRLDLY